MQFRDETDPELKLGLERSSFAGNLIKSGAKDKRESANGMNLTQNRDGLTFSPILFFFLRKLFLIFSLFA